MNREHHPQRSLARNLLAGIPVLLLLALQGYIVGRHDGLTLLLILITALFIWYMTASLWYSKRQLLNIYLKEQSFLQRLIKKRNTPWQILVCTLLSLLLGILFTITAKGIILAHGYTILLVPLYLYNTASNLIRRENPIAHPAILENHLNENLARHGILLINIFIPALLLNLLLTLLFSGYDTAEFMTSNINFENFIDYAEADSIMANGHNPYGRKIVNAFLLLDNLRIALGKFIAQELFHIHSYWLFYLIIAISNFMKLMFFSWAYILLCLGFEKLLPPCRAPHPDTEENP
ncbi:MAG: hypothetical protein D8H94_08500 [Cardiobacterium sp.]|nr:MAG: hypothetical protein D8H94_08500 [Cardiobacterium sp.]